MAYAYSTVPTESLRSPPILLHQQPSFAFWGTEYCGFLSNLLSFPSPSPRCLYTYPCVGVTGDNA